MHTCPPVVVAAVFAVLLVACSPAAPPPVPAPAKPAATTAPAAPAAPAATSAPAKPAATSAPAAQARGAGAAYPAPAAAAPLPPKPAEPLTAGAPKPAPAAPSGSELPAVQNVGRLVIYTTELSVLVQDLDAFPNQVASIALANGGYVAGVETKEEGGVPMAVVRLRIPPQRYENAMSGVRGLALEVRSEKATTQDVTEEYNDVQTQLASLESTHAQLLEIQKRAATVDEVLKVQQQAAQIKLQIDRLKGRSTAIERLSDYATIAISAYQAGAVLQRDYTSIRAALRRAESTYANLEAQLRRARTPEEEAATRDKLGETTLEITRHRARLDDITAKAGAAKVTLPTLETAATPARLEDLLPQQYLDTRAALRRAAHEQSELMNALRAGDPSADRDALSKQILEVNRLNAQLKTIQERANQAGTTLPSLTPEQEAALAGIPVVPGGVAALGGARVAWQTSLELLTAIGTGVVTALAFLWWLLLLGAAGFYIYRRRIAGHRS